MQLFGWDCRMNKGGARSLWKVAGRIAGRIRIALGFIISPSIFKRKKKKEIDYLFGVTQLDLRGITENSAQLLQREWIKPSRGQQNLTDKSKKITGQLTGGNYWAVSCLLWYTCTDSYIPMLLLRWPMGGKYKHTWWGVIPSIPSESSL